MLIYLHNLSSGWSLDRAAHTCIRFPRTDSCTLACMHAWMYTSTHMVTNLMQAKEKKRLPISGPPRIFSSLCLLLLGDGGGNRHVTVGRQGRRLGWREGEGREGECGRRHLKYNGSYRKWPTVGALEITTSLQGRVKSKQAINQQNPSFLY